MKEKEKELRKEIRRMTELARTTDEAEDGEFGPDFRGDELPEELQRRKTRLQKIKEAKKLLEEAQVEDAESGRGANITRRRSGRKPERSKGVPEDKKQSNFTDPESRIMKTSVGSSSATTGRSQSTRPSRSSWQPTWASARQTVGNSSPR